MLYGKEWVIYLHSSYILSIQENINKLHMAIWHKMFYIHWTKCRWGCMPISDAKNKIPSTNL